MENYDQECMEIAGKIKDLNSKSGSDMMPKISSMIKEGSEEAEEEGISDQVSGVDSDIESEDKEQKKKLVIAVLKKKMGSMSESEEA